MIINSSLFHTSRSAGPIRVVSEIINQYESGGRVPVVTYPEAKPMTYIVTPRRATSDDTPKSLVIKAIPPVYELLPKDAVNALRPS